MRPAKKSAVPPQPAVTSQPYLNPFIPVRWLRIPDAARYLSCTYTWVETLIREKTVPSVIQGKRRLIDIRDLDSYIDRVKEEAA
jgi:excisionase family DNA binding protein